MLYAILKPIVRTALQLYFRRINIRGLKNIDNAGPTLILANHTASFMDAILVACFVRRRIHFFARGDVFGKPWADRILRSMGLLPVYRLSEGRDKLHLNDTSNDEALRIMQRGGAVLIFCEGVSDIAKWLKPLKKGPFRLAANAAIALRQAPMIVPLGINYILPTEPCGDVFLEGAAPIATSAFVNGNDESARAKAATEMMRQTGSALRPLVWHTAWEEAEPLATSLLYFLQESEAGYSFANTQHVIETLNLANEEELRKLTAATADMAKVRPCRHNAIGVGLIAALVLLSPFGLSGWLFHAPVIWLAKRITHKFIKTADFIAPVFLSCALGLLIIWYLIILVLTLAIHPSWIWPPLLLLIAVSGVFYLKCYWIWLKRLFRHCNEKEEAAAGVLSQFVGAALSNEPISHSA